MSLLNVVQFKLNGECAPGADDCEPTGSYTGPKARFHIFTRNGRTEHESSHISPNKTKVCSSFRADVHTYLGFCHVGRYEK